MLCLICSMLLSFQVKDRDHNVTKWLVEIQMEMFTLFAGKNKFYLDSKRQIWSSQLSIQNLLLSKRHPNLIHCLTILYSICKEMSQENQLIYIQLCVINQGQMDQNILIAKNQLLCKQLLLILLSMENVFQSKTLNISKNCQINGQTSLRNLIQIKESHQEFQGNFIEISIIKRLINNG